MSPKDAISVLTIAGTDPSGGAGIQADLRTFAAFECYGTSVVTALVAQNTTGVQAVHPSPPEFVTRQIESVQTDITLKAIKTGMLYDVDNTLAIVNAIKTHYQGEIPPLVCDPVCVSTSGHSLLLPETVKTMVEELFPLSTLITPNKAEAELILSTAYNHDSKIGSVEDMISAAIDLHKLGPKAVLLKGGHVTVSLADVQAVLRVSPDIGLVSYGIPGDNMHVLNVGGPAPELVADVLYQPEQTTLYVRPRIESTSTHGTGCTLSAALGCLLAQGKSLSQATEIATIYTHRGIETAQIIGHGNGPLNHLHSIIQRAVPLPTPSNPNPLARLFIESDLKTWKDFVQHEFVVRLGKATLAKENFIHFIVQDYHYLKYYARAYALLAAKGSSFTSIQSSAQIIQHIAHESTMHKSFCEKWDISSEQLENAEESPATMAYGGFLIDVAVKGDANTLRVALAACLLGYGEVGLWLKSQAQEEWVVLEGNPYLQWIEDYSGEEYQAAVREGIAQLEAMAVNNPPSSARLEEWKAIWKKCTQLERGFWDMAMNLS